MKKQLLCLAFAACCFTAWAQKSESKFSIGFLLSPNLAYRTQCGTNYVDPNFWSPYFLYHHDTDLPKLGFSGGVLGVYSFNDRWKIQTGLTVSNNGWRIEKRDITWTNFTAYAAQLNFYHLDIPAQVKYIFLKKEKYGLFAIAGIEANFNVSNRYIDIRWYGDEKTRTKTDFREYELSWYENGEYVYHEFRKFNLSATAGIGCDIYLSDKITLFFQPTFRFMVLPLLDSPVEWRLFSAGLFSGLYLNL